MRPFMLALCAIPVALAQTSVDLAAEVRQAEAAFAQTMADRDHEVFKTFLATDAIFMGDSGALRGAAQVASGWREFFTGKEAPFSWAPETVEVLASGTLAHSSGPVKNRAGKRVATFNSIWRREPDGRWKVVFDKGCRECACAPQ